MLYEPILNGNVVTGLCWDEPMDECQVAKVIDRLMCANVPIDSSIADNPGNVPLVLSYPFTALHSNVRPQNGFFLSTLQRALALNANNIGKTFRTETVEPGFGGTHFAEVDVIRKMVDLYGGNEDDFDGCLLTNATSANFEALLAARDIGRETWWGANTTLVVTSSEAHHSIENACRKLNIGDTRYPEGSGFCQVGIDKQGRIDLNQIIESVRRIRDTSRGVFDRVCLVGTVGTTMRGAVDPIHELSGLVDHIRELWEEVQVFLHVDAALGGFTYPFLDKSGPPLLSDENVTSIAVDFYKSLPAHVGTGVLIMRRKHMNALSSQPNYMKMEGVSSGTKLGAFALHCLSILLRLGKKGLRQNADELCAATEYVNNKLTALGFDLYSSDVPLTCVKGDFPCRLRNRYIVHEQNNIPLLDGDPWAGMLYAWNVMPMLTHVYEAIDRFAADYERFMDRRKARGGWKGSWR